MTKKISAAVKFEVACFTSVIFAAGFIMSCATEPPPWPPHNPANPQVRDSAKLPRDLLVQDETTLAIQKELSATQTEDKRAKTMQHEMQNMPGMQNGQMQHGGAPQLEKKALTEEIKKTSNEMKTEIAIYTCPMHPHVHPDKPGNCRICGMNLVPTREGTHEEH